MFLAPAENHNLISSLNPSSKVLRQGRAPPKTHLFRCFQILQAPRIIVRELEACVCILIMIDSTCTSIYRGGRWEVKGSLLHLRKDLEYNQILNHSDWDPPLILSIYIRQYFHIGRPAYLPGVSQDTVSNNYHTIKPLSFALGNLGWSLSPPFSKNWISSLRTHRRETNWS